MRLPQGGPDWGGFLAVLLLLCSISILMPRGSWVLDESCRRLQAASMAGRLRLPPPIDWPGGEGLRGEDAEALAPLPFHYGRMEGGMLYAQYSPALAIAALPLRLAAGPPGDLLLTCIAASLLWLLLSGALRARGFSRWSSRLLPLAGTPLVFYGLTFWSHGIAALLVLAALLLPRGRGAEAMAAVYAAGLFRVEALLFVPLLFILRRGDNRRMLMAAMLLAPVLLGASRLITGSWTGSHVGASGAELDLYGHSGMGFLQRRLYVARLTLLGLFPGVEGWPGILAGCALWALWALSRREGRVPDLLMSAGLAVMVSAAAIGAARGLRLLDVLYSLSHPLLVYPALWLVRPARGRFPLLAGALLLLVLIMAPMHAEDLAWGSRLVMLPLLALVAEARPAPGWRVPAVAAAGALVMALSVAYLARKRALSADLAGIAVSEGSSAVVTYWPLTGDLMPLMERGFPVLHANTPAELALALDHLEDADPVIVTSVDRAEALLRVLEGLGAEGHPRGSVSFDPGLEALVLIAAPP